MDLKIKDISDVNFLCDYVYISDKKTKKHDC